MEVVATAAAALPESGLSEGIDVCRQKPAACVRSRLAVGLSGVSVSVSMQRSTTAVIRRSAGVSPTNITSSS